MGWQGKVSISNISSEAREPYEIEDLGGYDGRGMLTLKERKIYRGPSLRSGLQKKQRDFRKKKP
jgi:hypothetical protein